MFTTETLFGGRLQIRQRKEGYRFSTDSIVLAHHVCPQDQDVVVDLGTGCGILCLILAYRYSSLRLTGIELQDDLATLAQENVRLNQVSDRVSVVRGDIKNIEDYLAAGSADVVLSNPPYRKVAGGRISPNRQRALARHEFEASIQDVLSAAAHALKISGRFSVIYPADRLADLITGMRAFRLEPKKMRFVHSTEDSSAGRVYLEGVKGGGAGIDIAPPLIVHEDDHRFTEEMKRMMEG